MSRKKSTAPAPVTTNSFTESVKTATTELQPQAQLEAQPQAAMAQALLQSQPKRDTPMRYGKQFGDNSYYKLLLPWEISDEKADSDSDSDGIFELDQDNQDKKGRSHRTPRLCVFEEEFSGRSFSVNETSVYSFIEFLLLCAGRRKNPALKQPSGDSQDTSKDKLFNLTPQEFSGEKRLAFTVCKHDMMQRILFNNPTLNQDFISDVQRGIIPNNDPWAQWQIGFWSVNQKNNTKDPQKNPQKNQQKQVFEDFVQGLPSELKQAFDLQTWQKTEQFELFYAKLDRLRSTSFDNVTAVDSVANSTSGNMPWSSRMLFPYCQEALYPEANKQRYFRGQGHILFWMISLSSDEERKKRISRLLCENFFDAQNEQAKFISILAKADTDRCKPHAITTRFFPQRNTCELFEHYAEDMEHVLSLNLVQSEMFDVLQRLSSLYLILFLLERSSLMNARTNLSAPEEEALIEHHKQSLQGLTPEEALERGKSEEPVGLKELKQYCDFPYFLLAFDNRFYFKQCVNNYKDIITRIPRSLDNFVKFKIERELTDEQYFRIASNGNKDEVLREKDLHDLKDIMQRVFVVKLDKEDKGNTIDKDFKFKDNETYASFLKKVNQRFKLRRSTTVYNIDNVIEQLARNIGLASVSSNNLQFAVTDGFLKMLVLVTCKSDSPMRNKDFLDTIFKRYHLIVGAEQFKSLKTELKNRKTVRYQVQAIADKAFGQNEDALKERLNNQRLCCELSDNSFYYIFNPYKTKGQSKA